MGKLLTHNLNEYNERYTILKKNRRLALFDISYKKLDSAIFLLYSL